MKSTINHFENDNRCSHPSFKATRANVLMNFSKLDEAYETVCRSMALSETIFSSKDHRLCKTIRITALILEKQGHHAEAEKQLFRGEFCLFFVSPPFSFYFPINICSNQ